MSYPPPPPVLYPPVSYPLAASPSEQTFEGSMGDFGAFDSGRASLEKAYTSHGSALVASAAPEAFEGREGEHDCGKRFEASRARPRFDLGLFDLRLVDSRLLPTRGGVERRSSAEVAAAAAA